MRIEIDQSGKIEDTSRPTVIACANDHTKIIMISSVEKQKLVHAMRSASRPKKTYVYKIFAVMIFRLLLDAKRITEIVIDKEYPGQEPTIKNLLVQFFRKHRMAVPEIYFGLVGKHSRAHITAITVFRKDVPPDIKVTADEMWRLFYGR